MESFGTETNNDSPRLVTPNEGNIQECIDNAAGCCGNCEGAVGFFGDVEPHQGEPVMFLLLMALLPTANVSYIYTRVVVRFLGPVCLQLPPSSARFGWGGNVSGLAGTACTIHQQSSRLRDCLLTRRLSCVPSTGDCR
jgi:hypothetical protein